jgi:hypothetical protein
MQDLIKLFPDATQATRAKNKIHQQRYYCKTHNDRFPGETNERLEKFYDKEFTKWHYKLAFIILGCFISLYFMVANAAGIIKMIVS